MFVKQYLDGNYQCISKGTQWICYMSNMWFVLQSDMS